MATSAGDQGDVRARHHRCIEMTGGLAANHGSSVGATTARAWRARLSPPGWAHLPSLREFSYLTLMLARRRVIGNCAIDDRDGLRRSNVKTLAFWRSHRQPSPALFHRIIGYDTRQARRRDRAISLYNHIDHRPSAVCAAIPNRTIPRMASLKISSCLLSYRAAAAWVARYFAAATKACVRCGQCRRDPRPGDRRRHPA